MTIYKRVPIAKSYEMSVDGHIRRHDGRECDLSINKETNEIYLPKLDRMVNLEWLKYITYFEVDLPIKEIFLIKFDKGFQWRFANRYNVRMRLPKTPLIQNKYRIIPEFTRYAISQCGEVFDRYENKVVKGDNPWGNHYLTISVYNPDKNRVVKLTLHRLVALAWVPIKDPMRQYMVNHLDGNKLNPHASNLEWTDNQRNIIHAYENNLTPAMSCRVKDFSTGEIHEFYSIGAACRFMKIRQRGIHDFNGYMLIHGRYELKLSTDTSEWKCKETHPGRLKSQPIQVYNVSTKVILDFPSIKEACRQLNIWQAVISHGLHAGEHIVSKDYCFRYMPENKADRSKWTTNIREHLRAPKRILATNRNTMEVRKFNSAVEAEKSTGINRKTIVRNLTGKIINYDWSFKSY